MLSRDDFKDTPIDEPEIGGGDAAMTYSDDGAKVGKAQTTGLTFGQAFEAVKRGKSMRLPYWSREVVIKAQFPGPLSKMTAPYLYVSSRYGMVPWKETMIELFSENWEVV